MVGNRRSDGDDSVPGADRGVRRASANTDLEVETLGQFDRASEGSAPETTNSASAITVLVVDDDADMRRYVRRALRYMEAHVSRVIEASNGEEAMARLGEARVGLVISDVVMPVMDGYALSRTIRDGAPPEEIPILLITGELSPHEAADRARDVGAQGVVCKPFNAHQLCRAVEAVLDGREPRKRP